MKLTNLIKLPFAFALDVIDSGLGDYAYRVDDIKSEEKLEKQLKQAQKILKIIELDKKLKNENID